MDKKKGIVIKNFTTTEKIMNEVVKKSGGIITKTDIKNIFNIVKE